MTEDDPAVVDGAEEGDAVVSAGRLVDDEPVVELPVVLGTEVPHPTRATAETAATIQARRSDRGVNMWRFIHQQ